MEINGVGNYVSEVFQICLFNNWVSPNEMACCKIWEPGKISKSGTASTEILFKNKINILCL